MGCSQFLFAAELGRSEPRRKGYARKSAGVHAMPLHIWQNSFDVHLNQLLEA